MTGERMKMVFGCGEYLRVLLFVGKKKIFTFVDTLISTLRIINVKLYEERFYNFRFIRMFNFTKKEKKKIKK